MTLPKEGPIRVLVCGGRDFIDRIAVWESLDFIHRTRYISFLIHGAARGADTLGASWAVSRSVKALAFPADWDAHGRSAGPLRNQRMLTEGRPDFVVAFPGGRGTADMISRARAAGLRIWQPLLTPQRSLEESS